MTEVQSSTGHELAGRLSIAFSVSVLSGVVLAAFGVGGALAGGELHDQFGHGLGTKGDWMAAGLVGGLIGGSFATAAAANALTAYARGR